MYAFCEIRHGGCERVVPRAAFFRIYVSYACLYVQLNFACYRNLTPGIDVNGIKSCGKSIHKRILGFRVPTLGLVSRLQLTALFSLATVTSPAFPTSSHGII